MEPFNFSYQHAQVSQSDLEKTYHNLFPEIETIANALQKKYETTYASLHLPFDEYHKEVQ